MTEKRRVHPITPVVKVSTYLPALILVTLFSDRKRTLHDLLLGTVVSRTYR